MLTMHAHVYVHAPVCVCRCIHTDRCRLDPNRSGADVLMKPRPSVHLGVKWPRLRASWVKQEREGERKREKERKKQRRKERKKARDKRGTRTLRFD